MADSALEKPQAQKRNITRRQFLKFSSMAAALAGCSQPGIESPAPNTANWLAEGRDRRTPSDIDMMNTTMPGYDLEIQNNSTIQAVRAIPDKRRRVLNVAGFLDVERSARYDFDKNGGKYTCCHYVFDLMEILLGYDVIGSRYTRDESGGYPAGEPLSITRANPIWENQQTVLDTEKKYPYLHGNNFDWWARTYGVPKYGWVKCDRLEEVARLLKTGNYAGIGVHKDEFIKAKQKDDPGFSGHMAALVPDGHQSFGISQSTTNIRFRSVDPDDRLLGKLKEEYNVYLHLV